MTDEDEPPDLLAELGGARDISLFPQLFTLGEVLQRLRISRATFYRLVAAGKLRTVYQGRRPFVRAVDLIAYVRGLTEDPTHGSES